MTFFYVTITLRNIKKSKKKHKILEIQQKEIPKLPGSVGISFILSYRFPVLLLEQMWHKFLQATAPGEPLMMSTR